MKIKSSYLITLQATLFILFLLTTFFFNRFASDDYYFIGELKTKSFNEIYSNLYFNWNGRWTFNFLVLAFLKLNRFSFFLPLYNFISIGFLYTGIFRLTNSLNDYYQLHLTKNNVFTYAAITLSILFFCTISANDTWIWYTSSVAYLWSTSAFFWGSTIFFIKQKRFTDYLLLGLSAIYIGGSTEPLTLLTILALLFYISKTKKIIIPSISIGIISGSFLINYFSPGTLYRDDITPSLNFIDLTLYTGYGSIKFLFFSIYKTFIPALFLGIPIYLLGKKTKTSLGNNFTPLTALYKNLILILSIVVLNQLIVIHVLGSLPPDRSTITSSIAITMILIRYLFLLGAYHQKKTYPLKYILALNVLALFCFNIYFFNVHYRYNKAVDQRLATIFYSKSNPIEVKALPYSGYIYSAEITTESSHHKNQHFKSGLGINSDIILSKSTE